MTVVGELRAVLSIAGENAGLEGYVSIQSEDLPTIDPSLLYSTLDIGTDVTDSTTPRSSSSPAATQFTGFRVVIGGTDLPLSRRSPGLQVGVALGEGGTWSIAIPMGATSPPYPAPISSILNYKAAPPGMATVDIYGVYRAPSDVLLQVPIITSGIVHSASESYEPGQRVLRLNGIGPWGRYDHAKITLLLPPGMGLDRGLHVVRRIATQAGVSSSALRLQSAGVVNKEIQWSDVGWIERANAILEPSARLLHFDSDGDLTNPPKALTSGRYDHTFYLRDLVAGSLTDLLSARNDAPTTVEVTGVRQVTREDDCGIVVSAQVVETWAVYAPRKANFEQQGGAAGLFDNGSLDPVDSSSESRLRRVGLLYTSKHVECGDVVHEDRVEMGWYWPVAARYRRQSSTDDLIGFYYNVFVESSSAAKDDGNTAYYWPGERFVTLRDESKSYEYDDRGFLVSTQTRVRGWVHPRSAIKRRNSTPGVEWESVSYDDSIPILANGEGVSSTGEFYEGPNRSVVRRQDDGTWILSSGWSGPSAEGDLFLSPGELEVIDETIDVTDDGFVSRSSVVSSGPLVSKGYGQYLFQVEGMSPTDSERFTDSRSIEITTYTASDEGSHDAIVRRYDENGAQVDGESRFGLEGYLPAAVRRSSAIPDADLYEDGEVAADAALASREEAQRVEGKCSDPHPRRPLWTQTIESEYAETPEECERIACTELRLLSALRARFTLPAHFYVRPGQRVLLRLPGAEIAVHVKRVDHREGGRPGEPTLTDVAGDCYVV